MDTPPTGNDTYAEVMMQDVQMPASTKPSRFKKRIRGDSSIDVPMVNAQDTSLVAATTPVGQDPRHSSTSRASAVAPFRNFRKSPLSSTIVSVPIAISESPPMERSDTAAVACEDCEGADDMLRSKQSLPCANSCCSGDEESYGDETLTRSFAKLKSPTKGSAKDRKPRGEVQSKPVPCALVPATHGMVTFKNGTSMTSRDLRDKKLAQRSSQSLYSSAVFFPSSATTRARITDEDRTSRPSLKAASAYICDGNYGCKHGDCMQPFETADVLSFRQSVMKRRSVNGCQTMLDFLVQNLTHCYNRTDEQWGTLNVHVDQICSIEVCPAAFALLAGSSSSQLQSAASIIADPDREAPIIKDVFTTVKQRNEQRGLHFSLLRAYIAELVNKHEANPAPGAHQPGRMTHMNKQTWKQKWAACVIYFQNSADGVPGSGSMLKRAWKLETRLKEKRACSHSKCTTCSRLSAMLEKLVGNNSAEAKNQREFIRRAMVEHEEFHLAMRMELDQAGLKAAVDPRFCWTITADAATQRNFLLPKFGFRTPKDMARRPFWSYKLMATYSYGYGFTPYLVHDSQKMGANLTWTVIWLTLCDMRDKFGFWPAVLHITLDNTTGENKNATMIAMCAWLVSSGKVQQVRVLFLPVGHTHILIDHIFGVITVGLRRTELLVPSALVRNIDTTLAENPQYMAQPVRILNCLFDFKAWTSSTMGTDKIERLFGGDVQDADGGYTGMYDFNFRKAVSGDGFAILQYREHCTHPWLPQGLEGCKTISSLPSAPPALQQLKPLADWSMSGSMTVRDTISLCLKYARTCLTAGIRGSLSRDWDEHFAAIPPTIELLAVQLRLCFEHFGNDDVLRLTADHGTQPETGPEPETDMDKLYDEWKKHNVDVRTAPLAIDPVVSSAQSKTEFEKAKRALQAALHVDVGPSIRSTSPLLLGEYLLISVSARGGACLANVANVTGYESPYSSSISGTVVLYDHFPNANVNGLFGTFKQGATIVGTKRQQIRLHVTRERILVYNVGVTKKKHLTLASLRALAINSPEAYPLPRDIPDTHLDDVTQKESRRTARQSQRNTSAKPPPRSRKGSAANIRRCVSSSDDSSSDDPDEEEEEEEEEEVELASDGDGDELDDQEEEEETGRQEEAETEDNLAPSSIPAPQVGLLQLGCSLLDPKLQTVVAFNMTDDPQYTHMKYPFGIAFVTSVEPFEVGWFTLSLTQLAQPVRCGGPRGLKLQNRFVTVDKEWKKHDWWKDKRNKPSTDQIMDAWYCGPACKVWLIPLAIPQVSPADVITKDKFRMPMAWVTSVLIPACTAANCIHA